MSYELALKKAGLPLIRSFLQSVQSVTPGLPLLAQKRNNITYKFKTYRDGKVVKTEYVENLLDAFPARGDQK